MNIDLREFETLAMLYEKHVVEEKLRLFEKKYGKSFKEFEEEVKEKEDFEKWDDYMEWKAYLKSHEDINKRLMQR